jgi:hypothetical protein
MSAKSWWSAALAGAAAVLGSVIGGNTPAIAASDNNPRTYSGDYQGGSLPIGTFIAFQYGSFAHDASSQADVKSFRAVAAVSRMAVQRITRQGPEQKLDVQAAADYLAQVL